MQDFRKVRQLGWPPLARTFLLILAIILLFLPAPAWGAPPREPPAPPPPAAPDCVTPRPDVACVQATIDGRMTNIKPLETAAGTALAWDVLIANRGNVGLEDLAVQAVAEPASAESVQIDCPGAYLSPDKSMTCRATATAQETGGAVHAFQFIVTGRAEDVRDPVEDEAPACLVRYRIATCRPAIELEQTTNGFDADEIPGPYITPGDMVTWRFIVRNTGNTPLVDIRVTDDRLGDICTISRIEIDGQASCMQEGTAESGLFANLSTVTAVAEGCDATVTASDPCHYFNCAVDIEKSTNGEDADQPPGPNIEQGAPVEWRYIVRNTGRVPLTDLVVTDDRLGEVCRAPELQPDAAFTCSGSGISGDRVAAGEVYENLATVEGYAWSALCTADDPSHYRPVETQLRAAIALRKSPLAWRYQITNVGQLTLTNVVLASESAVDGPQACAGTSVDMSLPPDGAWCYTGEASTRRDYGGTASVSAVSSPGNLPVFDALSEIPYPELKLQLFLGETEVLPDAPPFVPATEPVEWRYVITNDTGADLSNVRLWHTAMRRDAEYALVCAPPFVAAGEQIECSYAETAEARTVQIIGSVAGVTTLDGSDELLSTDIQRSYRGAVAPVPGRITGRVFHDYLPANGIQDPAERGVAGVVVHLLDATGTEAGQTQTDEEGRYAFEVTPGTYRLRFAATAGVWAGLHASANGCLDSDADPASGLTNLIEVGDGATRACWDAGVTLARQLLPLVEK